MKKGQTYKEKALSEIPKLNRIINELRSDIKTLEFALEDKGTLDPIQVREMAEMTESFLYCLQNIRATANQATHAWDLADSVLRKYDL